MKKFACVFLFLALLGVTSGVYAHSYVALHKSTGVSLFSGSLAFRQAYNAASPGDTIYLPGGTFQLPDTIAKKIYVIGVGHYPSHTQATAITYLTGQLQLAAAASMSYFEGIHFNGVLYFISNNAVNQVVFRRCRIDGHVQFFGDRSSLCVGNKFIECVFTYSGYLRLNCYNATDLTFSNCIFFTGFDQLYSSVIENCLFLKDDGIFLNLSVINSVIKNNVVRNNFINCDSYVGSKGNLIQNNVVAVITDGCYGFHNNNASNNYIRIDLGDFFEQITLNNTFSYDFDFHLKNPGQYIGTDGTQVGIYGGAYPYKDGAVPFNPHVVSKNISGAIDAEGKVRVEVRVSAQQQ